MASNAENVSIWWRHHVGIMCDPGNISIVPRCVVFCCDLVDLLLSIHVTWLWMVLLRLPQCQLNNPEEYGQVYHMDPKYNDIIIHSQQDRTKHNCLYISGKIDRVKWFKTNKMDLYDWIYYDTHAFFQVSHSIYTLKVVFSSSYNKVGFEICTYDIYFHRRGLYCVLLYGPCMIVPHKWTKICWLATAN